MNVYLVHMRFDYETDYLCDIYSTYELAEQSILQYKREWKDEDYPEYWIDIIELKEKPYESVCGYD